MLLRPLLPKRRATQDGFTLIEIMVSTVVLGLAITGIVALLRNGRELEYANGHKRQAKQVAQAAMELEAYYYINYSTMGNMSQDLFFDAGPVNPIAAHLTVTVSAEQSVVWNDGISVPYKSVEAKVLWPYPYPEDSVVIVKRVAKVKG